MLQSIHDKLKGWVAGVVLGAIGLVFVFWGINWTLSAPTYAAKVNGTEISSNEVRQTYQQQLAQIERQSSVPLDDAMRNEVKQRVLEQYVNSEALVTRADELGYRVSDSELLAEMAKVPALQVDGKFDYDHALAVLKAQGRSPAEIEELFRRDAKLRQLDTALNASSFATPTEVKQFRALTRQQRELAWLTVSAAKYAAGATPDDAAVKAYYDAHKSEYMTPETVNVRYVELSLEQLASKVSVDDAQLKAYYEEQKAKTPERFLQPEQRRVRHILLSVNDPKADAAVKAKAEGILKRAQGGEDFSKLAKEFSEDPGSAAQGGDLGWSERKIFVGPFADAAFSMKVDEIRGPVKTQFGYHILKLDGIQPPAVKTFEEAKAELETEYKRNQAERLFNTAQDSLADAALQNATDIDVVAKKAGLIVKDVPDFSRSDGGGALGKVPAVIDAAFSQDVLDGHLSSLVEVEKGRGVVLRATDHKLPQQKPLEAVRTDVIAAWKKQRGVELASAAAADALKRLNAGESWDAVAKILGAPVQAPKFVARTDQGVPTEVRVTAFKAPKPAQKPVYETLALSDGDAAVLAVSGVREDPNAAAVPDVNMRVQYAAQIASGEAQSYAAGARADAKITLNPKAID
ncbi:MAG TPA: SurA N-terminal domain-containing protein [Steroidobacteraceae bacterium]|jgi:peptidyl-prolyl cis-trans isomerase D|nr:SurA N-terminal domain-containing protein [Steroidobacteraceae bacterium]